MPDFIKLPRPESPPKFTRQDFLGCDFGRRYPCLAEWLLVDRWENGQPRATTTLSLFLDEGKVKACLNDRETGKLAFVAAWTLTDVLAALEEGLLADTLDWRTPKQAKANKYQK